MDVTDDSGHVVHWIAETENPSALIRVGWTDKSLKPGDQITLTALPVKSGDPVGRIIDDRPLEWPKAGGPRKPGQPKSSRMIPPNREEPAEAR